MLRVTEYFAKSLKIIQNGTIRKLGHGFLLRNLRSIVTMALSCIVSEINRDSGLKSRNIFIPPAFDASVRGPLAEYYHTV